MGTITAAAALTESHLHAGQSQMKGILRHPHWDDPASRTFDSRFSPVIERVGRAVHAAGNFVAAAASLEARL